MAGGVVAACFGLCMQGTNLSVPILAPVMQLYDASSDEERYTV